MLSAYRVSWGCNTLCACHASRSSVVSPPRREDLQKARRATSRPPRTVQGPPLFQETRATEAAWPSGLCRIAVGARRSIHVMVGHLPSMSQCTPHIEAKVRDGDVPLTKAARAASLSIHAMTLLFTHSCLKCHFKDSKAHISIWQLIWSMSEDHRSTKACGTSTLPQKDGCAAQSKKLLLQSQYNFPRRHQ